MPAHRRPEPTPQPIAAPLVRSQLKVQHLSTLVSLGRHRNAHTAARDLNLSQPAVSKIVREVEEIFGVRLFDRGRNGMNPNRLGEVLLARAIGILNELENTRAELEAVAAGRTGYLRLGVIPFVTPALISRALRGLHEEGVQLSAEIREGTTQPLVEALLRKELDCVIGRYASERETDLDQRILYCQRFSAVVSPSHPTLGRARRIAIADTMNFGWIVPPPRTAARQMLSALFVGAGLGPPRVQIETSSMEVIKAILADSDLIALLPTDIAHHYVHTERLRILPFRTDYPPAPLTLIRRRGELALPSVERFCEMLLRIATQLQSVNAG